MSERVTQSELARLLGINRVQIHHAVNKGILELEDDGLLDFDKAVAALKANGDPNVAARLVDQAPTPLMKEIREAVAQGGDVPEDATQAGDPERNSKPAAAPSRPPITPPPKSAKSWPPSPPNGRPSAPRP